MIERYRECIPIQVRMSMEASMQLCIYASEQPSIYVSTYVYVSRQFITLYCITWHRYKYRNGLKYSILWFCASRYRLILHPQISRYHALIRQVPKAGTHQRRIAACRLAEALPGFEMWEIHSSSCFCTEYMLYLYMDMWYVYNYSIYVHSWSYHIIYNNYEYNVPTVVYHR